MLNKNQIKEIKKDKRYVGIINFLYKHRLNNYNKLLNYINNRLGTFSEKEKKVIIDMYDLKMINISDEGLKFIKGDDNVI